MFAQALRQSKIAIILLALMTILTGVAYPLFVTICAQLLFPWQANGSLLKQQDKIVGSKLIGQNFSDPRYFWGRPSATTPYPYNATNSSGSNLGPSNPELLSTAQARIDSLVKTNQIQNGPLPLSLITASGSGLDPDISLHAAQYQVARIARVRNIPTKEIEACIARLSQNELGGIFVEPKINVLELNLALEQIVSSKGAS